MNIEQAKAIPIKNYLDAIGIQPERKIKGGKEYRYFAYYRTESIPSLDVNLDKNIWIDRGEGIGGDIIDLVKREKHCNTSQALNCLESIFSFLPANKLEVSTEVNDKSSNKILSVDNLWDKELINYANDRQISVEILKEETKEITYKNSHGTFKAIGFKNGKNGWNLRSGKGESGFKGIIGANDISLRYSGKKSIVVVEGFFDFLSTLELSKKPYQYSYLILNGINNLKKASKILEEYENIWVALDNDEAGKKTTSEILYEFENAKDLSKKYKDFKDLNEFLINQ